jgi:hypothetical protein
MANMPDPKGVRSIQDGGQWLKKLTKHYIDKIVFPSGLNAVGNENIHNAIKEAIDDTAFFKHNMFGAVEQRCTWTATRSDGQKIFELEVNFSKWLLFKLKLISCLSIICLLLTQQLPSRCR